jgi:hypothetical protein
LNVDGRWYLDAWDATGGRGLASRREAHAASGTAPHEVPVLAGTPVIYVGPPGFEPELVTNSSIALSAGRAGTFAHRVPLEGPEAGFPSAQAVAEFVRRGFIAGGGGRTGGEEGAAPAPEGEPPGEPDAPRGMAEWLATYCGQVSAIAEVLGDTGDGALRAPLPTAAALRSDRLPDRDPVAWGGAELLAVMLAAFPGIVAHDRARRWLRAAASLSFALAELDLWRVFARRTGGYGPAEYLAQIVSRFWSDHVDPVERMPDFLQDYATDVARLILAGPPYAPGEAAMRNFGRWVSFALLANPYGPSFVSASHEQPCDRFAALYSWPLTRGAANAVANSSPDGRPPSVGRLLSVFVSSPGSFAKGPESIYRIVSFAAAFLASRVIDRGADDWRIEAATAWLLRSLPSWVFESRLEAALAQVGTSRALVVAR